jgi:hypothetical protein
MTQDTLFPLTDLKTKGYAQPEPRTDENDADYEAIGEAEAA